LLAVLYLIGNQLVTKCQISQYFLRATAYRLEHKYSFAIRFCKLDWCSQERCSHGFPTL